MASHMLTFAENVRVLVGAAHTQGAEVPAFVCPPKNPALDRAIVRKTNGVTISVRVNERPFCAVQSDLIEGIVLVNDLEAVEASGLRSHLWSALLESGLVHNDDEPTKANVIPLNPVAAA